MMGFHRTGLYRETAARAFKISQAGSGVDPACVTIWRAGDADLGSRLRRRRREVALAIIIRDFGIDYLTLTLRLPYDLGQIFCNVCKLDALMRRMIAIWRDIDGRWD
jgi:hypothetical protein